MYRTGASDRCRHCRPPVAQHPIHPVPAKLNMGPEGKIINRLHFVQEMYGAWLPNEKTEKQEKR